MKGDKEDGHGAEGTMTMEQLLTDPEQAADFVRQTQLDALAIAIGTSHGAYKFTRKPTGDILSISRIKEIHKRSEEHTSELQSLMRISYAVFCLKKKKQNQQTNNKHI